MKAIVSTGLALLILLPSFSKAWIVLSFHVNRDYISKALCINRERPELLCSGKCVLSRRMNADEERNKEQLPRQGKNQTQSLYCFDMTERLGERPFKCPSGIRPPSFYLDPCPSPFVKGIFRPPRPETAWECEFHEH